MSYLWVAFVAVVSVAAAFQHHVDIPRVSVQDFLARHHHVYDSNNKASTIRETPIIIEHVLTAQQCEAICEAILQQPSLQVQLQRRRKIAIDIYDLGMKQAIDYIMLKSSHDDAFWCFQEGLLDEPMFNEIRQELQNVKESVFSNEDWFQYFPTDLVPSDCVVFAGEGSMSTLHRDPFEWTGTSICLEGTKIWRFIEPPNDNVHVVDELLGSYRLPSTSWDDRGLSAGWQSDFRLYAHRHETIPSARDMYQNLDEAERLEYLSTIASSPSLLQADFPHLQTVWSTVQQTGDLLVIPAHWWHQTYGVEPSVAVASQRCSWKDAKQVMQHMVDTTGVVLNVDDVLDVNEPKQSVHEFFSKLNDAMLAL